MCLMKEDATNNDDNSYKGYCMKLTGIRNAKPEGYLMKLLFAIYPSIFITNLEIRDTLDHDMLYVMTF
jgi:hypothetical protein